MEWLKILFKKKKTKEEISDKRESYEKLLESDKK